MSEVEDFVRIFTDEKIDNVVQLRREFYQADENLMAVRSKIPQEPFAIGTFLGSGKPFHPSIALIDWIGSRTEKYVVIDRKAEWLFLCGRDIFTESILKKNADSGLVIIKNESNEVLGYGEFTKNKKVAISNVLDKGDFLRRENH